MNQILAAPLDPMAILGMILGVLWIFGWAILILIFWYLRGARQDRRLRMLHEERMKAIEKGTPLAEFPELYDPTARRPLWPWGGGVNPRWPLGLGAILVVSGLGVCLSFFLSGDDYLREVWSFGLIGVFVGAGLFFHYWLTQRHQG